jgi:hypothetical protein
MFSGIKRPYDVTVVPEQLKNLQNLPQAHCLSCDVIVKVGNISVCT